MWPNEYDKPPSGFLGKNLGVQIRQKTCKSKDM